ncbi:MAG TPA: response regulator [Polyangiaceae bacterium]|nr:response regulator [Polyangiaceae bacterium]
MPTPRVLLLEDNPHDAELVELELRRGGVDVELTRVWDRDKYVELLDSGPDLVISDYNLPGFDGLSALALLRARHHETPFILVSGALGEELAVSAMRQGVSDYLLKDRLTRLPNAVRTALEGVRLRREKEQLQQRLLRADRLESLGQLAAGIAHDLNNILLPIMMAAEVLPDSVHGADGHELLATIRTSVERGAKVLKQLLAFGRGTSGDRQALRLLAAIREVSGLIRETFPRIINLTSEVSAPEAEVLADPTQIQQILLNLCVNARDAMPQGGTLTLGLTQREVERETASLYPSCQPGTYAVLTVKDTGSGIAPADLDRIFDPFFTTKSIDQGTGLGLSSVLGIVKGHGGFIQVDSTPGAGSEFRVFIPIARGAEPVASRPMGEKRRQSSAGVVLLVDDEPTVRTVLRAGLSRVGYRVLEASDGQSGLERFRAEGPRIGALVVDLSMPRMDGLGLIRGIRDDGSSLPVIAMMGVAPSDQLRELKALGVEHVLQKPFGLDVLFKALAPFFSNA